MKLQADRFKLGIAGHFNTDLTVFFETETDIWNIQTATMQLTLLCHADYGPSVSHHSKHSFLILD